MTFTMRSVLGLGAFAALTLVGLDAAAQCSRDTDCKGNRVCLDGKCTEPAAPTTPAPPAPGYQTPGYQQPAPAYQQPAPGYQPAPAYQPAPGYQQPAPGYQPFAPGYRPAYAVAAVPAAPAGPLQWYQGFYGHLGVILGFHGWGGMSIANTSPSLTGEFKAGVHMSGYVPLSTSLHLGGYFNYSSGDIKLENQGSGGSVDHYSLGLSLKAGQRMAERIWLGFVGDLGFYALDPSGQDTWYGVELSPRVHLDVLALDLGGAKMGVFATFGPSIVPYVAGTSFGQDGHAYLIYLQMHFGLTVGF